MGIIKGLVVLIGVIVMYSVVYIITIPMAMIIGTVMLVTALNSKNVIIDTINGADDDEINPRTSSGKDTKEDG